MLYRIAGLMFFLPLGVLAVSPNSFAADCFIVGDEPIYRVSDCIDDYPAAQTLQKIFGSNYALVTDRKNGSILAVFLADGKSLPNQPTEVNERFEDSTQNADLIDQPAAFQPLEERRNISFPSPVPISDSDQMLDSIRSEGEIPAQFIISFGNYQVLYDLNEEETIISVLEREKPNLLDLLERQRQAVLEQPSEFSEKTLRMVEQGRNDLLNEDIILKSVLVLQQ